MDFQKVLIRKTVKGMFLYEHFLTVRCKQERTYKNAENHAMRGHAMRSDAMGQKKADGKRAVSTR